MATVARICKQITVEIVIIDYNYCEWLADFLYRENPIPHLSIRNMDAATLNTEFNLQNIAYTDNDEGFDMAKTLYVENKESGIKRVAANIKRQKEQTKSQPAGRLIADITVSHGFFVDESSRALGIPLTELCDYCAITSY